MQESLKCKASVVAWIPGSWVMWRISYCAMMSAMLRQVRDWISVVVTPTTNHRGVTKAEVLCLTQVSKCKMETIWVSWISKKASISPFEDGNISVTDLFMRFLTKMSKPVLIT